MQRIMLALFAASCAVAMATQVLAHGDQPQPKCKKGYELNDAHKCVR